MRRLPVYLLIDTSGSMKGEPIESVKVGLEAMVSSLRQDPFALESVNISIITFDKDVKQILPLTPLDELQLPEITALERELTHIGLALKVLCEEIDQEVIFLSTPEQKKDLKPLLCVMTNGSTDDIHLYHEIIPEVKKRNFDKIIVYAAAMGAKTEYLKELTDEVYPLDTFESTAQRKLFENIWVCRDPFGFDNIISDKTVPVEVPVELPPPPPELTSWSNINSNANENID
jgi:uncharacterized protein YegL